MTTAAITQPVNVAGFLIGGLVDRPEGNPLLAVRDAIRKAMSHQAWENRDKFLKVTCPSLIAAQELKRSLNNWLRREYGRQKSAEFVIETEMSAVDATDYVAHLYISCRGFA